MVSAFTGGKRNIIIGENNRQNIIAFFLFQYPHMYKESNTPFPVIGDE
jgi:hypothetical protein